MIEHGELWGDCVINGPFVENCYILADRATGQAIVVDPGDEEDRILARIRELGVDVQQIVNTHAHLDHVGAIAPLKRALGVPFAVHPEERPVLEMMPTAAAMFGLREPELPEIDAELSEGQTVSVGRLSFSVLHTPGHSPGGCCFYFAAEEVAIVGDTLFAGSIGRTDLPGGDMPTLLSSIRERLLTLPDAVAVYSGHGPATTIGAERRNNPFLQPA